jgi:hypothetical protein
MPATGRGPFDKLRAGMGRSHRRVGYRPSV